MYNLTISADLSEAIDAIVNPYADPYEGVTPNFDVDPQTGDFFGDEVIG
jgi:hypothetical protein